MNITKHSFIHQILTSILLYATVYHAVKGQAAPQEISIQSQEGDLGIIIDETTSSFGHEYSRQLSSKWLLTEINLPSSIAIREKPSALRGSLIEIQYKNRIIFSHRYQVRRADIEKLTETTISKLQDKLIEAELETISQSPDLRGTGL